MFLLTRLISVKVKEEKMENLFNGVGYGTITLGPKEEEVFCDRCEHHEYNVQPERPSCDRCYHPGICEKKQWVKPNAIRAGYWNEWIESGNCWRLNSNNDCEFYKKEEYPDRSCG